MKTVAITGAKGMIGSVLSERLAPDYDIIPIDLPECDVTDEAQLAQKLRAADVLIHLAGVFGPTAEGKENWLNTIEDWRNTEIFETVRFTAVQQKVGQFIHASSIHVEDSLGFLETRASMLAAYPGVFKTMTPSGHGRSKRAQERAVEWSASLFPNGAASIRLGAVTPDNIPMREHPRRPELVDHEQRIWLEHGDLARLIGRIIEHPRPQQYDVLYAVSANKGRFHDTSNRFGWQPQANSKDYL